MSIFVTGDIHSDVFERFSYKSNPWLKNLTQDDIIFQLGDFGVIWDKNESFEEKYKMNWLSQKPWTTIALAGNHENWDRLLQLPQITKFGGIVRDTGYNNIFIITEPTILDAQGFQVLCIPGANSHDIYPLLDSRADWYELNTGYSNLVDPAKDLDGSKRKEMRKDGLYYRVIGESWWPQEAIDVKAVEDLIQEHKDEHFDLILTHEAPNPIGDWYFKDELVQNEDKGQKVLDKVAQILDFDSWYHGHMHFNQPWPVNVCSYSERVCGLYDNIVQVV